MNRLALVLAAFAIIAVVGINAEMTISNVQMTPISAPRMVGDNTTVCQNCLNTAEDVVHLALEALLQYGVLDGCRLLCSYLPDDIQTICALACDYVGWEAFLDIINHADFDTIWYCEEVKLCPVVDCEGQCISIGDYSFSPNHGPIGTSFNAAAIVDVYNQTGTGETVIAVVWPDDSVGIVQGTVNVGFQPGMYNLTFSIDAQNNPNDDDVDFVHGKYQVNLAICDGECGSKYPNSRVYDTKNASFVIN